MILGQTARAACTFCLLLAAPSSHAQDDPSLPDISVYRAMLEAGREKGWAQFRDFAGHQWIYFTHLQTMHCRLSEIRYSINSKELDRRFPLLPCNPQLPFSLPSDAGWEAVALRLPPGTASTVAVQAVWSDGSETGIMVYAPCDEAGESTCARIVGQ